eukprot:TRINITY_DN2352_c0_g1_i1.p1 TRINITY_DN2352_c0_g1~~TRINITY_DN2352_c0_g1_i1.p1  ORF type:complete len:578 (+),score=115.32 TRINITY_DN2352_c0_g1_i1:75-1808(+)
MCGAQKAKESTPMFTKLAKEFRAYHKNTLNVTGHLATTPVGLACSLALLEAGGGVWAGYIIAVYSALLAVTTPAKIAVGSMPVLLAVYFICNAITSAEVSTMHTALLLAVSYILQDVVHFITGEPTFQSSYKEVPKFLLHTVYLVPLCVDAFYGLRRGPYYWLVTRDTTIFSKVTCMKSLENLRQWVLNHPALSNDHTTHWWYHDLKGVEKASFDDVCNAKEIQDSFHTVWDAKAYIVKPVHGMNEVYVASPTTMKTSDKVFMMDHIDGPWLVWPFCAVYRVLAAVNVNEVVHTELKELRRNKVLTTGDVMGFDFNREIHKVYFNTSMTNPEPRITLKLHYIVYPKCLKPFGEMLAYVTTQYDIIARNLFLYTIKPTTFLQKLSSQIGVLCTTYVVERFEAAVGVHNVLKVLALHAILPGSVFLYCTSFVHYNMYIATYYYRARVNYGRMLRDLKFWKFVSIGQLVWAYLQYDVSYLSVGVMLAGYALSASAALAIGQDRTYFGSELNVVEPKWISSFPYSCVPHPMILGSIVGLVGFYLNEGFAENYPFLVPIHCLLYVIHAVQEHLDIHDEHWKN